MLELVDHLMPNRTEAARLVGLDVGTDPADLVAAACFADVATIVLTLGSDGALVRDGDVVAKVDAVVAPSRRHHRCR